MVDVESALNLRKIGNDQQSVEIMNILYTKEHTTPFKKMLVCFQVLFTSQCEKREVSLAVKSF